VRRAQRPEQLVPPDGDLSLDAVADGYVDLIVGRMLGGRSLRTRRAAARRPPAGPNVVTAASA
jgi:hypothetical protein